jgi:hypothetical protein
LIYDDTKIKSLETIGKIIEPQINFYFKFWFYFFKLPDENIFFKYFLFILLDIRIPIFYNFNQIKNLLLF